MTDQSAALLRLFGDDDPETVALLKQQFTSAGPSQLPRLRELLTQATGQTARNLRETISIIESLGADAFFTQTCAEFGEHGDLEAAAWQLAAAFSPGEDFSRQRAVLDAWAAEVTRRFVKAEDETDRIDTLIEYLGSEVGLRGNEDDYYNLNNSLLPEVIDTRQGIPISLSLIYLFVAQRVGLEAFGIGFPGHFFIRLGDRFFDPFHSGRRLTAEMCRTLAEVQGFAMKPEHFQASTPREILTRILGNIFSLARESEPELAVKTARWIEALHGNPPR